MGFLRGKPKNDFILTWSKRRNIKSPGHVLSGIRMRVNGDGRSVSLVQKEQGEGKVIDGGRLIKGFTGHCALCEQLATLSDLMRQCVRRV